MKKLLALMACVAITVAAVRADDEVTHYGIWIGADGDSQELTSENVGDPYHTKCNTDLTELEAFRPYIKSGQVTYGYKDSIPFRSSKSTDGMYVEGSTYGYSVLTLNNATIESAEGKAVVQTKNMSRNLYVELIGDNYIKSDTTAMLFFEGSGSRSIYFVGDGTLTIECGKNGIHFDNYGYLHIVNTTLTIKRTGDKTGGCIVGDDGDPRLYIYHSTVTLDGGINGAAITEFWLCILYNCAFEEDVEYDIYDGLRPKGDYKTFAQKATIRPTANSYGVKINGIELTEDNINSFSDEKFTGSVSVNDDYAVIFDNATMQTLELTYATRIGFRGKNIISAVYFDEAALLNSTSDDKTLFADGDEPATLSLFAPNGPAIRAQNSSSLELKGDLTVTLLSEYNLVDFKYSYNLRNYVVTDPDGVYFDDNLTDFTTDGSTPYTGTVELSSGDMVKQYGFGLQDEEHNTTIRLHSKNIDRLLPTGASFDEKGNLVLSNATLNQPLVMLGSGWTIHLTGDNQINGQMLGLETRGKEAYIDGSGTLRIKSTYEFYGTGIACAGSLQIKDASVSVISNVLGIRHTGDFDTDHSLTLINANLSINSGYDCIVDFGKILLRDVSLQSPDDAVYVTEAYSGAYKIGDQLVQGVMRFAPDYQLIVGGTVVTADNALNIIPTDGEFRHGKITYYGWKHPNSFYGEPMLVLDSVDYTGKTGIEFSQTNLHIIVRGDNRIETTEAPALVHNRYQAEPHYLEIATYGNDTIFSLALISETDAFVTQGASTDTFDIEISGNTSSWGKFKVTIESPNKGIANYGADHGTLHFTWGADVTIKAEDEFIYNYKTVNLNDVAVLTPRMGYFDGCKVIDGFTELPYEGKVLHIGPQQPIIFLGGKDISEGGDNLQVGQTSGTVRYDAAEHRLTLTDFNATLSEGLRIVDNSQYDVYVDVEGTCTLTTTNGAAIDLSLDKYLRLYFNGNNTASLTLNGATDGIVVGKHYVVFNAFKQLNISGKNAGVVGNKDELVGSLYLYDSNVTISGGGTESAILNLHDLYFYNMRYKTDARYGTWGEWADDWIYVESGYVYDTNDENYPPAKIFDPIVLTTYTPVYLNGELLEDLIDSEGNLTAAPLTAGSLTFDAEKREITLTNATIDLDYLGAECSLTIRLVGKNTFNYTPKYGYSAVSCGAWGQSCDLTITGTGSLTIDYNANIEGLYCSGIMTFDNTNLTILNHFVYDPEEDTYGSGDYSEAIWAWNGIVLNNCSVTQAALTYEDYTAVPKILIKNPVIDKTITNADEEAARCVVITQDAASGIEEVEVFNTIDSTAQTVKILHNGHIYILKDGKKYNLLGVTIE